MFRMTFIQPLFSEIDFVIVSQHVTDLVLAVALLTMLLVIDKVCPLSFELLLLSIAFFKEIVTHKFYVCE